MVTSRNGLRHDKDRQDTYREFPAGAGKSGMLIFDGITAGGFDIQSKTYLAEVLRKIHRGGTEVNERGTYQTWFNLISRCHKLKLNRSEKVSRQ